MKMDEKTLLEICDRIYNNGFEIGSRHRLSRFIGYDIVERVPLDEEKLKAMKKLRIERVLKKFGLDITYYQDENWNV